MEKEVIFAVGVLSNNAVTWTQYPNKRACVKALVNCATIQKVTERTYVVRKK